MHIDLRLFSSPLSSLVLTVRPGPPTPHDCSPTCAPPLVPDRTPGAVALGMGLRPPGNNHSTNPGWSSQGHPVPGTPGLPAHSPLGPDPCTERESVISLAVWLRQHSDWESGVLGRWLGSYPLSPMQGQ